MGTSFDRSHTVRKKILVPLKIRVLLSGTLSRTLDLENFATTSRSRCQQKLSTVELVDNIYNDRCVVAVYYTSAGCKPISPSLRFVLDLLSNMFLSVFSIWQNLDQRFSNWGPRTKGGPRRVPTGSARGFRKVVLLFARFLAIYDPYVFKFAHISQSLSLIALRGSVAVVWHDRLSVDIS